MKYTAEMWDKMQHIMERYNDHMVHGSIKFVGTVNEELMKKAVGIVIDKVPILKSVFIAGIMHAEWNSIDNFSVDDIWEFRETDKDAVEESDKFLLNIIKESREAQIKVLLLRKDGKDTLNLLLNHMCTDGADFKEMLYLISRVYTNLLEGGDGNLPFKNGTRSADQLYRDFSPEQFNEATHLVSYSKKQKAAISYPFEKGKKKEWEPKIIRHIVNKQTFDRLKYNAKTLGVSINDVVLACFYRATLAIVPIKEGDALGIPNMVDLRRYIIGGASAGVTNLTSMTVSNLGTDIGADIFETVAKCKKNMDELKSYFPGLHGLPLLKKVFALTPFALAKFLIGTFFKNPLIGVSNIGIIDDKRLAFKDAPVEDIFITGSVKYPPYMQLALSTFRSEITHTVAVYGTEKDYEMFKKMFSLYDNELKTFCAAEFTEDDIAKAKRIYEAE